MVSVIMPVYNTAPYLDEAIESVLTQTVSGWELIAVDDGSTDSSGRMLDGWAARDSRIRVFHTENRGLSAARNLGLSVMSGDFIQFLDSDDRLAPTALEEALAALTGTGADMAIFDAYLEGMGTSFHEKSALAPGTFGPLPVLTELARLGLPPYAWNKFCKRALYDGVTFPVGEMWEDAGTTFRPIARAGKIAILGKPLYRYRQRPDAVTKTALADRSAYKWRFLQYRKRYEFLKQTFPSAAEAARESVAANGLFFYAFFRKSLTKCEKTALRRYLCAPEFRAGTRGKTAACLALFRLSPALASWAVRSFSGR